MQMKIILGVVACVATAVSASGPCCESCSSQTGTAKYYSVVSFPAPACGEACIPPSKYSTYKIFEPHLLPAGTDAHPCATAGFPTYEKTETHGVPGILSVTLDMYGKKATAVAASFADVTLYKVEDGSCGQFALDSKFAGPAEKFAGLTAGTCASAGYTHFAGNKTISVPVLGKIQVETFTKPSVPAPVAVDAAAGPCCESCASQAGTDKYYSVVSFPAPACGEACIPPSKYSTYKIFEPHLLPAGTDAHPCATAGFPAYEKTETHGIPGILSVTLDMYGKKATTATVSAAWLAAKTGAAATHYEDPGTAGSCQSGEEAVQIQGVTGDFCSPSCASAACPTDVPTGTTAMPECALETQGSSKPSRCALICQSASKCPANASCKMVQGTIGLCTYDK